MQRCATKNRMLQCTTALDVKAVCRGVLGNTIPFVQRRYSR